MKISLILRHKLVMAGLLWSLAWLPAQAEEVRALLQGYEWQAEGIAWPQSAVADLKQLILSDQAPAYMRRRAIAALAAIGSEDALSALVNFAQDASEANLQRRAVDELCGYGKLHARQEQIESTLIAALEADDQGVRFQAAKCLQTSRHSDLAARALEAYYVSASAWERRYLKKRGGADETSH